MREAPIKDNDNILPIPLNLNPGSATVFADTQDSITTVFDLRGRK